MNLGIRPTLLEDPSSRANPPTSGYIGICDLNSKTDPEKLLQGEIQAGGRSAGILLSSPGEWHVETKWLDPLEPIGTESMLDGRV